jgi:hypothetical protein
MCDVPVVIHWSPTIFDCTNLPASLQSEVYQAYETGEPGAKLALITIGGRFMEYA